MPSTQLNIKLGSDNSIFNHDVPTHVKRSSFNLGSKRNFTLDPGTIVPIDLIETVPGDSFEISVEYLLKSMPLVVAPFTNYTVRTHWYYARLVDLWKGAETFITKGRSGDLELDIPKFDLSNQSEYGLISWSNSVNSNTTFSDTPQSLSSYLGLPPLHVANYAYLVEHNVEDSGLNYPYGQVASTVDSALSTGYHLPYGGVSVLPFFMYQKIYRMAYVVPNLLQDSKAWFPDDISDGWRINYDCSNLFEYNEDGASYTENRICTSKAFFHPIKKIATSDIPSSGEVPSSSDKWVNILHLRFALFEDDRFTTALPWAQRGTAPKIDFDASSSQIILESVTIPSSQIKIQGSYGVSNASVTAQATTSGSNANLSNFSVAGSSQSGTVALVNDSFTFTPSGIIRNLQGNFNLNDVRSMIALSVWQERNSRTQGDYNSTIYAHFQTNPHSKDYEPIYIGGTSDVISFGEVVQTSESGSTPQGTQTGLGQTSASGNVGFFRAPDYGYIMGVMIIQPETTYADSVESLWTREIMEDFYMPETEGLGLKEVLKGEVKPTGTSSDNSLFGYQERNTEYKTRDNRSIGWFAVPRTVDKMFSAYAQNREFASQPSLSHQFVVMSPENMRRDYLAVPAYPAFRCSLASKIKAHRPMSYKNVPQTFGF